MSPRASAIRRSASSLMWPMRSAKPRASSGALKPLGVTWAVVCVLRVCKRQRISANATGWRRHSRASAKRSISSAKSCSTACWLASAGACSCWVRRVSKSSSQASRWSRISKICISMAARRWRLGVRGDSKIKSRAPCSWSASAAWCSSITPVWAQGSALVCSVAPAASAATVNWRACTLISCASDSSTSHSSCTR